MIQKSVKKVLNKLLGTYERRLASPNPDALKRVINFTFTQKSLPEYFDEHSNAYEDINENFIQLEKEGLVRINWKNKIKGHILEKIILVPEKVEQIYNLTGRVPKSDKIGKALNLIGELKTESVNSPTALLLLETLEDSYKNNREMKSLADLNHPNQLRKLVKAINCIENNTETCYIREFSIQHFKDSKALEHLESKICMVFRRFNENCQGLSDKEILEYFSLITNPNYVYFKGTGVIEIQDSLNADLSSLFQGIGISETDASKLIIKNPDSIKRVLTIENLTTFSHWKEPGTLIIYLGGFHNHSHRLLLSNVYSQLPHAEYLHFGDIDVGGFQILRDLIQKTGIPFIPYQMNKETLIDYERFSKNLTENDRHRLKQLIKEYEKSEDSEFINREILKTLRYMLKHGIKLEQEAISAVQFPN